MFLMQRSTIGNFSLLISHFSPFTSPLTQERFIKILNSPDLLASIPYEELKTLALAYPYAHNLRYLLALKGQQDNHPDAVRTLATAAAYSLDRTRLFMLVAPQQLTPIRVKEEVLELKPIQNIQRELDALAPVTREEVVEKQKVVSFAPPPPNGAPAETILPYTPVSNPPIAQPAAERQDLTPASPQPFASWIGSFKPPVLATSPPPHLPDVPLQTTTSEPSETKPPSLRNHELRTNYPVAQELAERSVVENKDVISETLARLLAKQGHREKAISMYERLSLAFPEKSGFFAAEIDKLKK